MNRYAIAMLLLGSQVIACNNNDDGKTIMTETTIIESLPADSLLAQDARDSLNQVATILVSLYSNLQLDSILNSIAEKKVNTEQVKKFIGMVKTDQAIIRKEIRRIAVVKNISIPGYLNPGQKSPESEWKNLSAPTFDTIYINRIIENLQTQLGSLQSDSVSSDVDVKYFTEKTIPYLRKHLEQARAIKFK